MQNLLVLGVARNNLPQRAGRRNAGLVTLFSLTALLACTPTDGAATKPEPQPKDGGEEPIDAFTEAAIPLPVDPCSSKDCGDGTCSVAVDGKTVCACKPGFGNLNGKDGTCVACKEVNGPLEVNIPAASAMAVVSKDGQPLELSDPVTIRLDDNDRGLVASLDNKIERSVPPGNYRAQIYPFELSVVPGYQGVPTRLDLGRVEVRADSKLLRFELPRVVQITARLPVAPLVLVLSHESGAPFTLYRKSRPADPMGIETSAELQGQFTFQGLPGKYRIHRMVSSDGQADDQKVFATLRASGAEAKQVADFSAPQESVATPIPIDLPVHTVFANLSVNDGTIPCLDCSIEFYATNGQYYARRDQTTGRRSAVLPSGTYLAMVSGSAQPRPSDGSMRQSHFLVQGGIYKIDHDQTIDVKVKLIKVSGKVFVNGEAISSKRVFGGGSVFDLASVLASSSKDASPDLCLARVSADGAYVQWLPANVAYQWRVELQLKNPKSSFRHIAETAPLETDLDPIDFDIKTKRLTYKVVAPPGFVPSQVSFNDGLWPLKVPGKDGAIELTLGKHTVHVDHGKGFEGVSSSLADFPPIDVTDSTDAIEINVSAVKISGEINVGNQSGYPATFSPNGPLAILPGITFQTRGVVVSRPGAFADLWLPPGHYNLSQHRSSYLGCYIIKPQ